MRLCDAWHRALAKTKESVESRPGQKQSCSGSSSAGRLHPGPAPAQPSASAAPSTSSLPRLPILGGDHRCNPGGNGRRGGRARGGPEGAEAHRAPHPSPTSGPASRSPASLCGGRVARTTAPPRPGPVAAPPLRCASVRPPSRSPQEPPPQPAAGRDSGAVAGSKVRLSVPVLSPAPASSPRRSAGRVWLNSSPSGSES